jgi:hypothetical protein
VNEQLTHRQSAISFTWVPVHTVTSLTHSQRHQLDIP